MGVNSLPKTVTRQRRGCDLNPGRTAPESSSTLTTQLPSHPSRLYRFVKKRKSALKTLLLGWQAWFRAVPWCGNAAERRSGKYFGAGAQAPPLLGPRYRKPFLQVKIYHYTPGAVPLTVGLL